MNPSEIIFTGDPQLNGTLADFWRWAFSDLCDDDIKGIFAEWMVRMLLGLPLHDSRRVSWADSDIILPNGTRIEVKASAVWQSWKLVNEDGTRKSVVAPAVLNPARVRFSGLQARTAVTPTAPDAVRQFKSDFYVFCFHSQTDLSGWGRLESRTLGVLHDDSTRVTRAQSGKLHISRHTPSSTRADVSCTVSVLCQRATRKVERPFVGRTKSQCTTQDPRIAPLPPGREQAPVQLANQKKALTPLV